MIGRLLRAIAPRDPAPEAGGLPWGDLYPGRPAAGLRSRTYAPPGSVAAATSSSVLAPANASRRALSIVNDSTVGNLYLEHGPYASSASYTVKLAPGQTYVIGEPGVYQGDVAGVWDTAGGSARVTETT